MTAIDADPPPRVRPARLPFHSTPPETSTRPNRLTATSGRYHLDGRPIVLRAAELQYFRVPAEQWANSVARLRDAGCNAIASYIPWSWHEPSQGRLDFSGRTHPQRDLIQFLETVRHAGLVFLARPGPFIYAEYRGFGYPDWLREVIPEALARRPNGRPASTDHYQLYSLLHPAHLAQVDRWLGAVAQVLRPYLNDPVVSWQLDNETGMLFTIRVGDLDFNPDTVARYRAHLREEYEDASLLAHAWGRRLKRFDDALPPTAGCAAREMADWQTFMETWITRYLQHLRQTVRSLGIDLPLAANEPAEYLSPQNPRLKSPVAQLYGYDSYVKVTGSAQTADFPFASSHHPLRFQPFANDAQPLTCWELGAGWWDWRARVSPAATVQSLGAGLAHGLKGYNLYAAQDGRDPGDYVFHFGGLLDEDGQPTARLEALARLQAFVARHEDELTASAELQDPIAYLEYQPYTRLTPEDCRPVPELPVPVPGLLEPMRYFAKWGLVGFHAVLSTAGYNAPFIDLESATDASFGQYTAAVFPSRGYLDEASYAKLRRFVGGGGHLVTFPEAATQREDGTRLDSRALWPHPPAKARWFGRARLIAHLIARWMLPYYLHVRWKTARLSPGALHLSDLIEPALVGQAAPLRCVTLRSAGLPGDTGDTSGAPSTNCLGGDFRLVHFAEGGEVLLRDGATSAGYRARVGDGTSTLLGTVLGGAYTTSRYYTLSPQERLALRRFAVGLFEPVAPRRIAPEDGLEVETVARLLPDGGCLLFVINRLGAQTGTIRFPSPAALTIGQPLRAEAVFSAFGSRAGVTLDGLAVDLQPDDVLIVRLR
ncbi:MAG: beta-galactosidase [Chloroflexota bacterium]